jgi:transcriptional regulator with XRE-family HTH domain
MSNQDQDALNWRSVLQKIIEAPKERQRIAAALGINAVTLTRWARRSSRPQQASLARLLKVVPPQYKLELQKALKVAYPSMEERFVEETAEIVPSTFFRQILKERATVIETLRPWQLTTSIINEAITLLDPHNMGMAITAVLCMPPVEGRIRSLREQGGRGTYPWVADLEHQSIFLGMNSLAGYVVQNGRPASVHDVKKEQYIPVFAYPEDWEASAAACPIWLEGKIAGCLLAASQEIGHFTQTRMDLLIDLTNIFSLALNASAFYDHRQVHLRYIPHPRHQGQLLRSFRQFSNSLMAEAMQNNKPISSGQAETLAWQKIEDELLEKGSRLETNE